MSPILDLIREARDEGIKRENWKKEKFKRQIGNSSPIVEDY